MSDSNRMPSTGFKSLSPSCSIPTSGDFRCPACRARQPVQDACRRCQADLTLLAKMHRRIDYLINNPSLGNDDELAMLIPTDRGTLQ